MYNRANAGLPLFKKAEDFREFERTVADVIERFPLRILGYTVMRNHWHFVVWPQRGKPELLSDFFRALTIMHAQRWHSSHGTTGTGHVYQGRFKSFPIAVDEHLRAVLRFVEANPRRAGLVEAAEDWRWGSLYRRTQGTAEERALLAESPVALGRLWTARVNRPQDEAELAAIRLCGKRGQPYGDDAWRTKAVRQMGLEHTLRPRGRPRIRPAPDVKAKAEGKKLTGPIS